MKFKLVNMASMHNHSAQSTPLSNILGSEKCDEYLIFPGETSLEDGFRAFLYFLGLAYCFIGLSAITARFFRSTENVVKHSRTVVEIDPLTNTEIVRHEKVWNYTIADITLLAFGTSFPQISLATIDAIRNIGNLYAGGLFCICTLFTGCLFKHREGYGLSAKTDDFNSEVCVYVTELLATSIVLPYHLINLTTTTHTIKKKQPTFVCVHIHRKTNLDITEN